MTRGFLVRSTHTIRCPACGQRIETPEAVQCELCGLKFDDERATGVDATPFAKAYQHGVPGWRRMCEWVWYAGAGRLKHLALMRSSAASRRFAVRTGLLLAAGLGVVAMTGVGWRKVTASPVVEPTGSIAPVGMGWYHLASTPSARQPNLSPETPVSLWWNPGQSLIAGAFGFASALAILPPVIWLIRLGLHRAHQAPYRAERRLTAAVDYGLAWVVPGLLAVPLLALRPFTQVGRIRQWSYCPTEVGANATAGVVIGLAGALWWFWMVRAAATSPARTRARVVGFVALGAPATIGLVSVGWWFALRHLLDHLFRTLGMNF